ncbi:heterokaryon incompatibility protein-domain-containing protein [Halenospora varia]|nr:heterokaryon incompatibility protein-domain-containing protein [Halenospora varia]
MALIDRTPNRILGLCSDLRSDNQTQISFPELPATDSPLRFALLRAWLQWCDKHTSCKYENYELHDHGLPTRLLSVGIENGSDYNPDFLKLVSGQEIGAGKYIALSHCWGKLRPGEVPRYCTTQDNIVVREKGFSIADLPLTFRDAVKVARGLQVQYLWIDSLCIIQGKNGDWDQESERMEGVYASAYCTVAATSAIDSNAGFLKRNVSSEYVHVQDDSGRTVYVCTGMADFDKEVEKEAVLNTRAWVMQERFLSRRTIHFGASQVYWECGEGVYCEDLVQLRTGHEEAL